MRKEFLRQLALSMAAMDPLVWSYYLSSRLEAREHLDRRRPQERSSTVVRNSDSSIVAGRRTAA